MGDDRGFDTDLSQWPLVIWRMRRVLTIPEFQAFLKDADGILERGQRYAQVVVSQVPGGSSMTSETRKLQSDWTKQHYAVLQRLCAAMTVVLPEISPLAHFTASFFMSALGKMPSPSKIFTSEDEAVRWARAQLEGGKR